jgi:hypothetical protein
MYAFQGRSTGRALVSLRSLLRAGVRRVSNDAGDSRAKGEAALLRAKAKAVLAEAAATTTRAGAEAAATTARASADTTATMLGAVRASVFAAAGFLVALGLAVDLVVHESPEYIVWSVKRTLRSSVDGLGAPAQETPLPVPQPAPTLSIRPLMLLGPTGCGKSSLLMRVAHEAASARVPVIFVRWRISKKSRATLDAAAASTQADAALTLASDAFFKQIGYPQRRAVVFTALKNGVLFMGKMIQADLAPHDQRDRLTHALRVLFEAAAAVKSERAAAGVPAADAAPVLLFDEAHDLVKDERLAQAGGASVFKTLALLLISFCVDQRAVRAIVAGSSVELDAALRAAAPYGNRWRHYELADPAPDVVVAALEARGYAPDDARALVAECGTRMRLLEEPMLAGPTSVRAADTAAAAAAAASKALAFIFDQLAAGDAAVLARVLDSVAVADAASIADGVARPAAHWSPVSALPASARDSGDAMSAVVYADLRGRAHFQSRPVARAWARDRGTWAA